MTDSTQPLRDRRGRAIEYLRLSLTGECNFRCPFCQPPSASALRAGGPHLAADETIRLAGILCRLGVESVKVTGGEPFLHPGAVAVMAGLKTTAGARRVTLTTNGSSLDRFAKGLVEAGVDCANVSLNALSQGAYAVATGSGFELRRVLDNIRLARRLGLALKINTVPLRGVNDRDIVPLAEFALDLGVPIKFIELMPIGNGRGRDGIPPDEVRRMIERRFGKLEPAPGRHGNGPAAYWRLPGGGTVGFIEAVSRCFCADCNRVRLTATGFLRTCLHHDAGADLLGPLRAGEDDERIAARIRAAVLDKPERHRFEEAETAPELGDFLMSKIGG